MNQEEQKYLESQGHIKKYWFRPKRFGYGLTPISWEGWFVTLIFIFLLLGIGKYIGMFEPEAEQNKDTLFQFVAIVLALSFLFVRFSEPRCDGKIKWRWGLKK